MKGNLNASPVVCFESPLAPKIGRWAAPGFLASLGFIPGWERMLGFSGFFGFIGVAFIVEMIHRFRHRRD